MTTFSHIEKDSPAHNRVYWHSRRGMLELDMLLMPFAKKHFPSLNAEDQQRYMSLLKEEDQDLFLWLMQRSAPDETELQHSIAQILAYAQSTTHVQD
ncbi:MAG: succinate dehydrogenase assembly factor 2 [Pseudomonadota bacterium]